MIDLRLDLFALILLQTLLNWKGILNQVHLLGFFEGRGLTTSDRQRISYYVPINQAYL